MKHFTTRAMSSEIGNTMQLNSVKENTVMIELLVYAMDTRDMDEYIVLSKNEQVIASLSTQFYTLKECAVNFVFGGKYSFPWSKPLYETMSPAEFGTLVELRKWVRNLQTMCEHSSPRFWVRSSDFVYVNLNRGRCVVFVDGLYKR